MFISVINLFPLPLYRMRMVKTSTIALISATKALSAAVAGHTTINALSRRVHRLQLEGLWRALSRLVLTHKQVHDQVRSSGSKGERHMLPRWTLQLQREAEKIDSMGQVYSLGNDSDVEENENGDELSSSGSEEEEEEGLFDPDDTSNTLNDRKKRKQVSREMLVVDGDPNGTALTQQQQQQFRKKRRVMPIQLVNGFGVPEDEEDVTSLFRDWSSDESDDGSCTVMERFYATSHGNNGNEEKRNNDDGDGDGDGNDYDDDDELSTILVDAPIILS